MERAFRSFVADGYVFTECVNRNGILRCQPNGFYKFPLYYRPVKKETPSQKEEVSDAE